MNVLTSNNDICAELMNVIRSQCDDVDEDDDDDDGDDDDDEGGDDDDDNDDGDDDEDDADDGRANCILKSFIINANRTASFSPTLNMF